MLFCFGYELCMHVLSFCFCEGRVFVFGVLIYDSSSQSSAERTGFSSYYSSISGCGRVLFVALVLRFASFGLNFEALVAWCVHCCCEGVSEICFVLNRCVRVLHPFADCIWICLLISTCDWSFVSVATFSWLLMVWLRV